MHSRYLQERDVGSCVPFPIPRRLDYRPFPEYDAEECGDHARPGSR